MNQHEITQLANGSFVILNKTTGAYMTRYGRVATYHSEQGALHALAVYRQFKRDQAKHRDDIASAGLVKTLSRITTANDSE